MPFNQPDDSAIMARQARCIGAKAKTLVRTPGFSGHVMAVLPGVAYLSGRDEEILWLFQEGVPLHGRGILLSFPAGYLRPGQTFLMKGQVLRIGSDLAIDLGRAAEWTPDSPRPWQSGPLVRVNDLVRQLLGTISEATSDDDPGQVIRGLSSILNGSNAEPFSPESWQRPILAAVFGLMKHCLEEGLCEIEIRGRELIGLGPGLTPCGDDFLGGILFAAHWLQEAYPGELQAEARTRLDLVQWARDRTHPISHAILGDLAIGQGPEPLHNLLGLLFRGDDRDGRTKEAVNCLLRVGHTTGWYILAGVLTCLLSVNEN